MTSFGYLMATSCATIAIAIEAVVPPPLKLIWNASASAPVGLYGIAPAEQLAIGDLALVAAPAPLARFLSERGYLAKGVPLIKRVAALPGQRVCRVDGEITIDGTVIGTALERDRRGRDLPVWCGCRIVADGELFLMNGQVRDSLDGRYFGPLPASAVIGRATPLLTDEAGDGRLNWRSPLR
jgi:conjugative transfer signal peptidase TraF